MAMNKVPINQPLINFCQEQETGKYRGICFSQSGFKNPYTI